MQAVFKKEKSECKERKKQWVCDAASMDMHGAFLLYYNLKTVTFDIPVV